MSPLPGYQETTFCQAVVQQQDETGQFLVYKDEITAINAIAQIVQRLIDEGVHPTVTLITFLEELPTDVAEKLAERGSLPYSELASARDIRGIIDGSSPRKIEIFQAAKKKVPDSDEVMSAPAFLLHRQSDSAPQE